MTIRDTLTPDDQVREGVTTVIEGQWFASFETATDEDYFLFLPKPNTRYSLTVDAALDTELGIFSTPELVLAGQDDDSGFGLAPQLPLQTGARPEAILIEVDLAGSAEPGAGGGASGVQGSYVLEIVEEGPVEPPEDGSGDLVGDSISTSGGLAASRPVERSIGPAGDLDIYAVWLQAGRDYRIGVTGQEGLDPALQLFEVAEGPDGEPAPVLVAENDDANDETTDAVIRTSPPASTFAFVGVSAGGDGSGTGPYELTLAPLGAAFAEDTPDLVGDTLEDVEPIEPGLIIPGKIDPIEDPDALDFDVFAVELFAGSEYVVIAQGYDGFIPALEIGDPDGSSLALPQPGPTGSATGLVPEQTGTHFVAVSGSTVGLAPVGTYDLAVVLEDPAEVFASEVREIALLYEAGLGRTADEAGLNFWVDAYEGTLPSGGAPLTLGQIAQAFLGSPEFRATVGDVAEISDEELVLGLYENVLERDEDPRVADPDGFGFWLNTLRENPEQENDIVITEAQLLQFFALSPENRAVFTDTLDTIAFDPEADTAAGEFDWGFTA